MKKRWMGIVLVSAANVVPMAACSDDSTSPGATAGSGGNMEGGAGNPGDAGGASQDAKHDVTSESSAGKGGQAGSTNTGGSAGSGGTVATGGTAGSGGTVATGGAAGTAGSGSCTDSCPAPSGGVTWGCEKRFMYGVNYAWLHFAGDFGGISPWGQGGVAAESSVHLQNLNDMHANGASVIRWWMFPDFRSNGITFGAGETPTGLGVTTVADVHKALELAEQANVFLMLTIFSFDNFRPSADVAGIWTPGITPMVKDATKRAALIDKVVRPVAQAVQSSPYARRMIAWDVINEPEWAMTGPSPYGDPNYESEGSMDPVTHGQMETFVSEIATVLRAESSALISVGGAAFKWAHAWQAIDTDFHHFHMYEWINTWWPYTGSPSDYGLGDKPLVMGELPMGDLANGISYQTVLNSWWANGYAGAMSWQYNQATASGLNDVKAFADLHPCETRYTAAVAKSLTSPMPSSDLPAKPATSLGVGRLCGRTPDGRPTCL